MTSRTRQGLIFAAALGIMLSSQGAFAQQTVSLNDLDTLDSQNGGQASQTIGKSSMSPSTDQTRALATEASQQDQNVPGAGYQPAKPDLRYASPAQVDQIQKQENGDYGSIDRSTGVSAPLGTIQDAWDKPYQNMAQGQVAPGVVRYRWSQDLVMPVRMREYMSTFIVLPAWETVQNVFLGDQVAFAWRGVRKNTIEMRVQGSGGDTNVSILGGSGNLYTFYLRGEGYNSKSITDFTVFVDAAPINPGVWFKGQNGAQAGNAPQGNSSDVQAVPAGGFQQTDVGSGDASPENVEGSNLYIPSLDLKFVHKMYEVHPGDRAIAPEYVATDGRWTYFYYGAKAGTVDRPVVYRIVDGVEENVPTRTIGAKGETIVAEATGEFALRNGQKEICIKINPDANQAP